MMQATREEEEEVEVVPRQSQQQRQQRAPPIPVHDGTNLPNPATLHGVHCEGGQGETECAIPGGMVRECVPPCVAHNSNAPQPGQLSQPRSQLSQVTLQVHPALSQRDQVQNQLWTGSPRRQNLGISRCCWCSWRWQEKEESTNSSCRASGILFSQIHGW